MNEDGEQSFNDLYLITDYHSCTLSNVFKAVRPGSFTVEHALTITYNLLCAVHYLHTASICHHDIKPESIIITKNCNVLIKDFDNAKTMLPPE